MEQLHVLGRLELTCRESEHWMFVSKIGILFMLPFIFDILFRKMNRRMNCNRKKWSGINRLLCMVFDLWFDCYCRSNANGQIGNGTLEEVAVPVLVEIADPVKYVASGANHNLAITCEYFSSTLAIDESWHADEFFFSFNSTLAGFLQGNNSTY